MRYSEARLEAKRFLEELHTVIPDDYKECVDIHVSVKGLIFTAMIMKRGTTRTLVTVKTQMFHEVKLWCKPCFRSFTTWRVSPTKGGTESELHALRLALGVATYLIRVPHKEISYEKTK